MKILLTGFDPFDKEKVNPAFEAVKKVKNFISGAEIVKTELPTVFYKSARILESKIEQYNPDIIICVGQAGGRFDFSIERVAINIDDARIQDNEGQQPIDKKIREDGENAYFSSLPIKSMVQNIRLTGIPASVSNTAGTFVCNHVMYSLLYLLSTKYKAKIGGFIHVPYITEQVIDKKDTPSMSVENIVKGLEAALEAAVKYDRDIVLSCGKIC